MTAPLDLVTLLTLLNGGGLQFVNSPTFEILIPSNAGTSDPRIYIGSASSANFPADLVAYYAGQTTPWTVHGGIVMYTGTDPTYEYLVHITNPLNRGRMAIGGRDNGSVILELMQVNAQAGAGTLNFSSFNNFSVFMTGGSTNFANLFQIGPTTELVVDSFTFGRGFKSYIDNAGASGAIGAEAVVLTAPAVDYYAGRAYKFTMGTDVTHSVAGTATFRIRRTNLAGAVLLGAFNFPRLAGALSGWDEFSSVGVCTADVNQAHALTLQASAGTVTCNAAASRPRWFKVEDCGADFDYPNAPAI